MKKLLLLTMALCCVCALTACGQSVSSETPGEQNPSQPIIQNGEPQGQPEGAEESGTTQELANTPARQVPHEGQVPEGEYRLKVAIGETIYYADLKDNSSVDALVVLLQRGPLMVDMHDYGNFEKVGTIPETLPRNDEHITTGPGDIILYQGNQLVLYYSTNTWTVTHIGNIPEVTTEGLLEVLGAGNVVVEFSLEEA